MTNWTDALHLPLLSLTVTMQAQDKIILPPFAGSKLEGTLGEALFSLSCVRREHHAEHGCLGCPLHPVCAYGQLYAPLPAPGFKVASAKSAPRPIAFDTHYGKPRILNQGDHFSFGLTLMGRALTQLPFLLNALHGCGENGIGKTRGKFTIRNIVSRNPYSGDEKLLFTSDAPQLLTSGLVLEPCDFPPIPPGVLTLRFLSMLQIKYQNKILYRPDFPGIVSNLQRRLSNLEQLYGAAATTGLDYSLLPELARSINVVFETKDHVEQRRSKNTLMSGFIGTIRLEGDLTPFTRLLRYGELVGVGRWASFGMGRYRIEAA